MHVHRPIGARSCLWALTAALVACGDDSLITSGADGSSSTTAATTGATSSSSGTPTTGATTGSADTDTGGGGTGTGSTGGDDTTDSGTTMGVDPGSSTGGDDTTSTGDGTTSSTGDGTTSSTGVDTTTSSSTGDNTTSGTSTGDDTTSGTSTGDDFACDAPPFPDLSAPPLLAGCPQTTESTWCLALSSGSVTAIGLDTQTTCQAVGLLSNEIEVSAVGSFGVVGSELFTCTSEFGGLVARASLFTGAVELSTIPCTAVTTWRGHLVVQDSIGGDTLDLYDNWATLLLGQVAWSLTPPGLFSETLNTQGDTLYAAWHSGPEFDRFELPCGEPLGPVMLEGFDDWMQGIAVTDDLRFITYGFDYNGLRSFDANTGTALAPAPNVFLNSVGLACFTQ